MLTLPGELLDATFEQLRKLLSANNVDRAKKLCDATTAPVARVAKAGLNRLHRGEAAVAQAMEETMTDTLPEVKTRVAIDNRAAEGIASPMVPSWTQTAITDRIHRLGRIPIWSRGGQPGVFTATGQTLTSVQGRADTGRL